MIQLCGGPGKDEIFDEYDGEFFYFRAYEPLELLPFVPIESIADAVVHVERHIYERRPLRGRCGHMLYGYVGKEQK